MHNPFRWVWGWAIFALYRDFESIKNIEVLYTCIIFGNTDTHMFQSVHAMFLCVVANIFVQMCQMRESKVSVKSGGHAGYEHDVCQLQIHPYI